MTQPKLHNSTFYVMKRAGMAINRDAMLQGAARVVVALSGGYASLCLLLVLIHRRRKTPVKPEFLPVFVPDRVHGDPGAIAESLAAFCRRLDTDLIVAPGSHRDDQHWEFVPHRDALVAVARQMDARHIALAHTAFDCAVEVFLGMTLHGEIRELAPVEPFACEDGFAGRFIRPLRGVTHQSVMRMARAEQFSWADQTVPHPRHELIALLEEFVRGKRGNLLEKLKNMTNAPAHVNKGYLA